jgi:hypothetical protein
MTCEVLLILATLNTGNIDIRWHCTPSLDACWDYAWDEIVISGHGHGWSCVEIGSLVDYTRRDAE